MTLDQLQTALAALSHRTRLAIVTAVAEAPDGSALPSEVAAKIGIPRNLLSAHLLILVRAGLVVGEDRGRNRVLRLDADLLAEVGRTVAALADHRPQDGSAG